MKEELTSRETVEQIISDVCGIDFSKKRNKKKKKKNRGKMMEADIDIFADEEHLQIRQSPTDDWDLW